MKGADLDIHKEGFYHKSMSDDDIFEMAAIRLKALRKAVEFEFGHFKMDLPGGYDAVVKIDRGSIKEVSIDYPRLGLQRVIRPA